MIPVKPDIAERAHINSMEEYERLYRQSLDDPEAFWRDQAERLAWFQPPMEVVAENLEEVDFAWFAGGRLNACYNCVDRHLADRGDKTAIIWAGDEPGEYEHITYRELKHEVCRMANVLTAHGVRKGDRVSIYMPMIPELAYTMLACARIGAIHSVVFAGFSRRVAARPHPRRRLQDRDHRQRGAARRQDDPAQEDTDDAVDGLDLVETVLVARRTDKTDADAGRAATSGSTRRWRKQRSTCTGRVDGRRGLRCSSSTPPARRASPRACCTPPAATWSTPR